MLPSKHLGLLQDKTYSKLGEKSGSSLKKSKKKNQENKKTKNRGGSSLHTLQTGAVRRLNPPKHRRTKYKSPIYRR